MNPAQQPTNKECDISDDVTKSPYVFAELLVDALFKPGMKLNPEHKPKYVYLVAYAASVCETWTKKAGGGGRIKSINKEELKATERAVERVAEICASNKGSGELLAELATLYECIK